MKYNPLSESLGTKVYSKKKKKNYIQIHLLMGSDAHTVFPASFKRLVRMLSDVAQGASIYLNIY